MNPQGMVGREATGNGLDEPLDLVSFSDLFVKVNKYSANDDYDKSYYCKILIK